MLPLSAIRQMMPAMGALPTQGVGAPEGAAGVIPAADLQQLAATSIKATSTVPDLRPAGPQFMPGVGGTSSGADFSSVLGGFINEVNSRQAAAGAAVRDLQSGGNVTLHQAVLAMEEASVSFQLMVEVRNKLLESYQELMRMQI